MGITWFLFLAVASLLGISRGDYQCVCNDNVEIDVLDSPTLGATPIGHMYELDCKALYQSATYTEYLAIQFGGKVGYVKTGVNIHVQDCQGYPLTGDLVSTEGPPLFVTANLNRTRQANPSQMDEQSFSNRVLPPRYLGLRGYMISRSTHITSNSIPVTWPQGSYGLMMSSSGCPGGGIYWHDGWRKFDTEDDEPSNYYSSYITSYMKGSFNRNNLVTWFCINDGSRTSQNDLPWPPGHYCLLRYGKCPAGFSNGSLFWDDEDDQNSNSASGTLPTGIYNSDTMIEYCCRRDGLAATRITLPTNDPFILLRIGPTCQAVYNMQVVDLYVRWDDEDDANHDRREGVYPDDDGGSRDHQLHFCHYHATSDESFVPVPVG